MDRYLPIPFNKTYFACSNGKIYNKRGKEIGKASNKGGYSTVSMKHRDTNIVKQYYVHRLIWETFNGNIPEGYEIDHINTNRSDNRLENLRIANHKENCNNSKSIEKYRTSNKGKGFCGADYISTRVKLTDEEKKQRKKEADAKYRSKHKEEINQKKREAYRKKKQLNDVKRSI